ncbi:hypothetical protein C474_07742 [Halogeometricum pallidum JCM 14848]|uniref:Uncharacterized protein n=2 Tax=Halogeometricum TaxID=60846 RepID=M0DD32_HALPD|nr:MULTISPECIES: hypothetical protein [Halogeometricum]ELZ32039.1 hypothetical protein C474_07742 [Halogeometricum pallidum JCM 14848]MDS0301052.1 hypothetical protein [Halogeometricum sp. S1BR25-6]
MLGLETASGSVEAITTIGLVLVEAVVLYVGYGALSSLVGQTVLDAVGGE